MKRFLPRFLLGFSAIVLASAVSAQRPTYSVDYFPEGVRVEGEPSPASHLHVVDITSPGTLTLGENITATVSVQVATDGSGGSPIKPAGISDEEALSHIKGIVELPPGTLEPGEWTAVRHDYDRSVTDQWLADTVGETNGVPNGFQSVSHNATTGKSQADVGLVFTAPNQIRTIAIIYQGSATAAPGGYGYKVLVEDWPREDEGVIRNPGTFINATLGAPLVAQPPTPSVASPAENEIFVYNIGNAPVEVPIIVTGTSEEGYPITDFQVAVTDRGNIAADMDDVADGLGSTFVSGNATLGYTDGGLYDVEVTATNSVGDGFTSSPFEVVRVLPSPSIAISSPAEGDVFTYLLGAESGVSIPVSVTAETEEDGRAIEGIQTLTAEIAGSSIALADWSVGQLNPTGNGSWFGGEGTYTVIAETTNNPTDLSTYPELEPNSNTANDAVTFTIEAVYPDPTVEITSPTDGDSFQRNEGNLATEIAYTITGGITYQNIASVNVTITSDTGDPVNYTANVSGEGTDAIAVDGIIYAVGTDDYTIAVEVESDNGQTATDSVVVIVNETEATPPTVDVSLPNGSSYTFEYGSGGALIPVTFSAATDFGVIDTLTGQLNTDPVTNISITDDGISTPFTTGTSELLISVPGNYTIKATATTVYGQAVASATFTVEEVASPTVTIVTPDDGFTLKRVVSDPVSQIDFTYAASVAAGQITEIEVTVNGSPFVTTIDGIGSASVTGLGTLVSSDTETFVILVTATTDRGETSFDRITVEVVESDDPPDNENCSAEIEWLRPINLGKVLNCGQNLPIKFRLRCKDDGEYIIDDEVIVAVSVEPDGGINLYPNGQTPNGGTWKYTGNKYHKNFRTDRNVAQTYRVEVFRPIAPGSDEAVSLGSRLFKTENKSGKSDKSGKSAKSAKSGKSGKSDKSDKLEKSGKSDKSSKSDKSGKSDKSDKSNKSQKSSK